MTMNKFSDRVKIMILAGALAISPCAFAQTAATPVSTGDDPIEITAGSTLEWHRNDNQYIARGEVEAKQGDTAIYSETLTADYRAGEKSANEIYLLTAEQDVRVQNTTTTIYGEKAVYDVDKAYAVMTGNNLKMVSPDQTVTARDRMEYWSQKGEAIAVGDAKVVRLDDTLTADTVKAIFKETPQGQEIDTLHATGHVVIITPAERLTGDKGVYHSATNTAEIFGNVHIIRGPNILEGDRAEVDMNTNISKIFGGPTASGGSGDGRVRGIFYPGTDKTEATAPAPAPTPAPPVPVTPTAPQPLAPTTNSAVPAPLPAAPSTHLFTPAEGQ